MGAVVANEGFAQIRNGLKEHIEAGKLCPTDLGVYTFLHMYCDYSTGIYTGTALGIAFRFGDASYKGMVNKSLARLKKIKFINYREGNGKRGGYRILLDKFEPTFGELRGSRLNAWKADANGNPIYDAGTVEERLRNGEGTVEERLRKSQGRVEERVPYIHTTKREDGKTSHTTTDPEVRSSSKAIVTAGRSKAAAPKPQTRPIAASAPMENSATSSPTFYSTPPRTSSSGCAGNNPPLRLSPSSLSPFRAKSLTSSSTTAASPIPKAAIEIGTNSSAIPVTWSSIPKPV
jgi:hypothetical protein